MKELHGAEFCCGKGVLTRCLRFAGYKVVGLDILDWDRYAQERALAVTSNPLDMLNRSSTSSSTSSYFRCPMTKRYIK